MKRTGLANLPLHTGKAPFWLFRRMVKLAGVISELIVDEYNQKELLNRISNPYWFQAFSCVIGFDWHSSGTTTTSCGALKESLKDKNLGIFIAGGKGNASRKTPTDIDKFGDSVNINSLKIEKLKYCSRMSAKVDNSLVQDSYQLYHHCFFFTEKSEWAVVQQGINQANKYARRYHWLSDNVFEFVEEPHNAICCNSSHKKVLDMTAKKSDDSRKISLDIVKEKNIEKYFRDIRQKTLMDFFGGEQRFVMQRGHFITDMHRINIQTLKNAYELQPKTYEELVAIKGVGPKTIRALALVASVCYGSDVSWKDPARYSFAHGGKDGIPYPVDRKLYDDNIDLLENSIQNAKLGEKDKIGALKRLAKCRI
jgi:hypothetical protein